MLAPGSSVVSIVIASRDPHTIGASMGLCKKTLLLLFIVLANSPLTGQVRAESKLEFSPQPISFGTLGTRAGTDPAQTVTFKNVSSETIYVGGFQIGCGCISVDAAQAKYLKTGESTSVSLRLHRD